MSREPLSPPGTRARQHHLRHRTRRTRAPSARLRNASLQVAPVENAHAVHGVSSSGTGKGVGWGGRGARGPVGSRLFLAGVYACALVCVAHAEKLWGGRSGADAAGARPRTRCTPRGGALCPQRKRRKLLCLSIPPPFLRGWAPWWWEGAWNGRAGGVDG